MTGQVRIVRAGIQELPQVLGGAAFDVVACHAVLEWLADPGGAVAGLATFLQAGGFLSLMFDNREAAPLKRVLGGEFAVARRELESGPERRGWGTARCRWPRRPCAGGWPGRG